MGGTHVAAAVALTLIAAAAASSPTGRAAGAAIDVTVDTTTGMYTIDVGGVTWLRSANTSVNVGSKLYSTADKTLQLKSTNSWKGTDGTGSYSATQLQWMAGSTPWFTTFRTYADAIAFEQAFPSGADGTATGDREGVMSSFPSFVAEETLSGRPSLGFVGFAGDMDGSSTKTGMWGKDDVPDGISGTGPVVLFTEDLTQSLVLSAFSQFMTLNQKYDSSAMTLSFGPFGNASSIPAGYSIETVATLSPNGGVNGAMEHWGDVLLGRYGNSRSRRERDFTLSHLGYSTDVRCAAAADESRLLTLRTLATPQNGAYYYYLTEQNKTYEQTMIDVKSYMDSIAVPIRYVLLDSWWYYKDPQGDGVLNWTAMTSVFPHNLTWLNQQTGWPVQGHNRFWSPNTNYAKQNGGPWEFIVEEKYALPIDADFWDWLLRESAEWGLVVYEQDWLDTEYDNLRALTTNVTLARQWLMQMGRAAEKNGLSIQYCMSHVRHILQSVEIPAVTQARASGDYSENASDQWNLGTSSILAYAVGIGPSKDNYWSTEYQSGNKWGPQRFEPYSRLQSAVLSLSSGPVTPSDKIGDSNAELIMRGSTKAGTLLSASRPATAIDAYFVQNAFGSGGPDGQVWSTATEISGRWFANVISIELGSAYSLKPSQIAPAYGAADASFVAFEANTTDTLVPLSESSPLALAPSDKYSFQSFAVSQVFDGEYTLLGEPDKWVPVSAARFVTIDSVPSPPSMSVTLNGDNGEVVNVNFMAPGSKKVIAVKCIVGQGLTVRIDMPAATCSQV